MFWSGENVGISKTEAEPTKLTALEIKAEEHHRKTAKFNIKKIKWSVKLPWIDPELESLKRVTAMMRKVHDVVLEEDMPMVNQAYMDRTSCIRLGGRITFQPGL